MGWFYGFKLHIIVNDKGETLDFIITQANVDDRTPLKSENFLKKIIGSIYGDKGYLSKELASLLFGQGLHLITGIRNNMKNICQAEHSRHRSFGNFITNLVASIIAYSFQEKKPGLNLKPKVKLPN